MKRSALVTLALVVGSVGSLVFAGACSSGGGGTSDGGTSSSSGGSGSSSGSAGGDAGCQAYVSDAGDLTTPSVSFATQIMPTFQASCGIAGATCHGNPNVSSMGRPFLDYPDGGANVGTVLAGIVGKASTEDPQMDIVKAGDPTNSYLMHKLDGDQCTLASACAKGNSGYPDCGQPMPYSSPALDQSTRDTIRRWIAQGAKNN